MYKSLEEIFNSVFLQFLQQMSGRALLLILFFWAVLTVVTPILVRLSASTRANGEFFVITHTSELIKERIEARKVWGCWQEGRLLQQHHERKTQLQHWHQKLRFLHHH
ncbi:hypothetical protein K7X08_012353 [Anisodus acutangulus]|uniref:Uncharacterized protein n=1 Tax=Anisodus acutangulus TaxID=402998 RepID=A0A9Q1QY52_9SOLA|nr:hypothetical protein K7X08_012353 [Anisodus acutangulus]